MKEHLPNALNACSVGAKRSDKIVNLLKKNVSQCTIAQIALLLISYCEMIQELWGNSSA